MRVLVIEDDDDLAEVLLLGLRQEHLAVDHASTVADAVDLLTVTRYDIVCLDLGLPDGDGLQLCRRLRSDVQDGHVRLVRPDRVLILTARDAVADRVAGLDAGADDYLIKPVRMAELAARVRALARRGEQQAGPLLWENLSLDAVRHSVERNGEPVDLTGREFAVLRYFLLRIGEVISSEELLEHCWDVNVDAFSGSVRVILSRLRRKLGDPPVIHTIKGVGYRL